MATDLSDCPHWFIHILTNPCLRAGMCLCLCSFLCTPTSADVNECQFNNGGCGQTCINTVGSFKCACAPQFTLNSDKRTCTCKISPPRACDFQLATERSYGLCSYVAMDYVAM